MEGIDYNEIFSHVVKYKIIRIILYAAASSNLEVEQLYFKTTFLHGGLNEKYFMSHPKGFVDNDLPYCCCLLKKILVCP